MFLSTYIIFVSLLLDQINVGSWKIFPFLYFFFCYCLGKIITVIIKKSCLWFWLYFFLWSLLSTVWWIYILELYKMLKNSQIDSNQYFSHQTFEYWFWRVVWVKNFSVLLHIWTLKDFLFYFFFKWRLDLLNN